MKKITTFVKENKLWCLGIGATIVGGIILCKVAKNSSIATAAHIAEGERILEVLKNA